MNRKEQLRIVQDEGLQLFEKKNADYGDAFATYGTIGVLVRMGDKIMRLQNITNKGITLVDDEKIRDTLIDLHNYAAMAVMLLDEKNTQQNHIKLNNFDLSSNRDLQDNSETIEWGIYGPNNDIYKRTQTRVNQTIINETCSCPSYQTSNNSNCEHISQ